MKGKKGLIGSIISGITFLAMIGIFLAVLAQFDGNLGDMFRWILDTCWSFIISVRDTLASWETFQGLF